MNKHIIETPVPGVGSPDGVGAIDDRRVSPEVRPAVTERRSRGPGRRKAARMRILKGAEIVLPIGGPERCIVRNISETGALLEVHVPILGREFELIFDDERWPSRSCHVVWRKADRIGVAFSE